MDRSVERAVSASDVAPIGDVLHWPSAWRRFYFEPWRWADTAWFSLAGIPHARYLAGSPAMQRMLMAGWCNCFGLQCELGMDLGQNPRNDGATQLARWLDLMACEPGQLRLAAGLVGWVLRLDAEPAYGAGLADPARRQALHYLQARPLRLLAVLAPAASVRQATMLELGLSALARLAASYARPLHARVLMLLPPERGVPWLMPADDDVSLEQQAALTRLARLWQAAQRWAGRMSPDGRSTALQRDAA